MPDVTANMDAIVESADAALALGDFAAAARELECALAASPTNFDLWMRLASVRRAGRNISGALGAIERALSLRPLDFLALLMQAHVLEQMLSPTAGEIYGYALAQAPVDRDGLAPTILRMLGHAREQHEKFLAERDATLTTAMSDAVSIASASERHRLVRFRDNVLRRKRVYHSEPTDYFYPGLCEREFHDRADFAWLADVEAAADAIRDELKALLVHHGAHMEPYVQYEPHVPIRQWASLNHSRDWTAMHLLQRGRRIAGNADRCPRTMAALAMLPQPEVRGYGPNAMFSWLAPGTHIPPHTGVANTRLICHLPLLVPNNCWFRVGAETREWREGEAFVFDDTIEHEAANDGDEPRVVLIFDVWHPGLTSTEQRGVAALLGAGGRTGRVTSDAL